MKLRNEILNFKRPFQDRLPISGVSLWASDQFKSFCVSANATPLSPQVSCIEISVMGLKYNLLVNYFTKLFSCNKKQTMFSIPKKETQKIVPSSKNYLTTKQNTILKRTNRKFLWPRSIVYDFNGPFNCFELLIRVNIQFITCWSRLITLRTCLFWLRLRLMKIHQNP